MDHTTLNISQSTKEQFDQAHDLIQSDAENLVTQDDVVCELVRVYLEKNEVEA